MHSVEDAKEGEVCSTEAALLKSFGFLRLCDGGIVAVMATLMLLGATGCGNGEVDQEGQQDPVQDKDRCPLRC